MNAQDAYALIAGVVAVGGVAAFLFREGTRLARAIATLSERVAVLEADNKTFWNVMGPHMAKIIHEDVAPDRDELADRFTGKQTLTEDELRRLQDLLRELANDESVDPGKRMSSSMLIALVAQELEHRKAPEVDATATMRPRKRWWRR